MSDLPPDLNRLQVLRTYLRLQLEAVDARIRQVERTGDARPRPTGRAATPARPARPPRDPEAPPDLKWWRFVHAGPGTVGGTLHRGDCRQATGGTLLALPEAKLILDEGARPCRQCAPEARLRQQ